MAKACVICTRDVPSLQKFVFCTHELCSTCKHNCSECPFCRQHIFANVDVVAYIETITQKDLLQASIKAVTARLQRNRLCLEAVHSEYAAHWKVCADFILQAVDPAVAARALVENQVGFERHAKIERFPLWVFLQPVPPMVNFSKSVRDIYGPGRTSLMQRVIMTITERRNVILKTRLDSLLGAVGGSTACVLKYSRSQQTLNETAHRMIKQDLMMCDYVSCLVSTADEGWLAARDLQHTKQIHEETVDVLRNYYQAPNENSNFDAIFTTTAAIMLYGNS